MRRWLALVATAAAGVAWVRWRPFRVVVAGQSMEPTLRPGDFLVAVRTARIRRGDVVVVAHPGRDLELVKRVAAVPGDEAGGEPLEGRYLVVGDNPGMSTDGRSFGPVDSGSIGGVVLFRYWPRPGFVVRRR